VKFAFISDMETQNAGLPREQRFPVDFMCEMLEVSRPGYYAWRNRDVSRRVSADDRLTERIVAIHREHRGR
jgi:hypothetical protein